jgi:hypothetical protein
LRSKSNPILTINNNNLIHNNNNNNNNKQIIIPMTQPIMKTPIPLSPNSQQINMNINNNKQINRPVSNINNINISNSLQSL